MKRKEKELLTCLFYIKTTKMPVLVMEAYIPAWSTNVLIFQILQHVYSSHIQIKKTHTEGGESQLMAVILGLWQEKQERCIGV